MAPGRQLAIGPLIGVLGAILLAVSLFVDWYGGATAWTVFEALDLLLAAIAVASLLAFAERLGLLPQRGAARTSGLALPLALLALVVVVSQLIHDPPAVLGFEPETDPGAWLALAGAALLVAGALLSVARISVALDVEGRATAGAGPAAGPTSPAGGPGPAPPRQPLSQRGGTADPRTPGQHTRPTADPDTPTVARPGEPRAPGATPAEPRAPGDIPGEPPPRGTAPPA